MRSFLSSLASLLLLPLVGNALALPAAPTSPDSALPPLADSVFFYEQRLYAPGDYGSANWRIPALCALPDGTLLAVNDKRKLNEGDLPQDIDIVCRRSTDRGRTWSEPATIVAGTGLKHGFGDPALVVCENGDVVLAFAGGNGFWQSSSSDPIRTYICRSTDGGQSWSAPDDITSVLWGDSSAHPAGHLYRGSFCASGNGLRLTRGQHRGRIMFVAAMVRSDAYVSDNYVLYSDDNGFSWHLSQLAFAAGDEAKVVELTDGRVLMSIRQSGARGCNISLDGGITWGEQSAWPELTANACNGEILRLSATDQGGSHDILLHSLPNSMNRENVSLFVSYDEGLSWHHSVPLCQGPSVYSSLTLLPDGTIGAYIEKNTDRGCELWFQHFSYAWYLSQIP